MAVMYAKRESALEPGERVWTADAEALTQMRPGGADWRLFWRDLTHARVTAAGTARKPNRYVARFRFRNGEVAFDNLHYAEFAKFEDRSESFSPFITTCLGFASEAAPDAVFRAGASWASYLGQVAFVGVIVVLTGLAIAAFGAPDGVAIGKWVAGGAVLALFFWWMRKAWPRRLDPSRPADMDLPTPPDIRTG